MDTTRASPVMLTEAVAIQVRVNRQKHLCSTRTGRNARTLRLKKKPAD